MRLMMHSNMPWAATGYGVQTAIFAQRWRQLLGHEVACSSIYGLQGGPMAWNGITCYPSGFEGLSQDVVPQHAEHFCADLILTLFDAWVLNPDMIQARGHRWVPWFPVDSEPIPAAVLRSVEKAWQPVVFSRFGEQMAREAGLDVRYVPHGVDTAVYRPAADRAAERERRTFPEDRFVVGIVAANKGIPSRKSWPEMLDAFARLHRRHPEAMLYLHTFVGTEMTGVNIAEYVEHLGIPAEALKVCEQYQNLLGYPPEWMAGMFSSLDVLMNVAKGEGFGVPIAEAQACGTPVLVGGWTAMEELCLDGWLVSKDDADRWWTPQAGYQFKPRVEAIDAALEEAFDEWSAGRLTDPRRRNTAARTAGLYDADMVTRDYWGPFFEECAERIHAETVGDLPPVEVAA